LAGSGEGPAAKAAPAEKARRRKMEMRTGSIETDAVRRHKADQRHGRLRLQRSARFKERRTPARRPKCDAASAAPSYLKKLDEITHTLCTLREFSEEEREILGFARNDKMP
jgi:hypothetical protein